VAGSAAEGRRPAPAALAAATPREGCGGPPERAGLAAGETERQRTPKETVAKLPPQASVNARKQHGKGMEWCFCVFLQQSPKQPDPERSEGARPKTNPEKKDSCMSGTAHGGGHNAL